MFLWFFKFSVNACTPTSIISLQVIHIKILSPSRLLQVERDIQAIIDVKLFVSPFSKRELVCISNGMIATKEVKDDFLSAEEKGRAAMKEFVESRLAENAKTNSLVHVKRWS